MLGRKNTILAATALVAAFGLAACEGDTGPQGAAGIDGIDGVDGVDGQDGLGHVPPPAVEDTLGPYDSNSTPTDATDDDPGQTIFAQLIGNGNTVWEIQLDGQVQLDLGTGTAPVITNTVRYDSDHDELWIEIDGQWVPFTDVLDSGGDVASLGCAEGVPLPCVDINVIEIGGDYAWLSRADINHGPATETTAFAHYGVETDVADIPTTGSFDYSGTFVGRTNMGGGDELSGTVDITVDYDPGALSVTFDSSGDGQGTGTYTLSGEGDIVGNSYSGTLTTAEYDADGEGDDPAFDFTLNPAEDDTFSGMFYGPASDADDSGLINESETAGVVDVNHGDNILVGGFVAGQTGETPK